MPELPEVETVRRGLEPGLRGRRIERVIVYERRLRWPLPPGFEADLAGARIQRVERRAKYLLLRLEPEASLILHLGMTGSLRLLDSGQPLRLATHDHVVFELDDGARLIYHDPRRFGSMHRHVGSDARHPLLAGLGPEPLSEAFHAAYLHARLAGRRAPIKLTLMDQAIVVGIGNIYANEALFRAGIHPARAAGRISLARLDRLVVEIKAVLYEAIAAGGSTLRDFFNARGEPGYFQLDYAVYGRGGQPCRCCASVLREIRLGGRSTVYCPRCQR
jgi:DNA-(apurinic or apyrimidinic site) lyase (EC 4.2.99.18)/Formamidopyrimidine-DNA glycosylase (EC 3.2.2.23)